MTITALVLDRRSSVRNAFTQPLKQIGIRNVVEINAQRLVDEPFDAGKFDVVFVEFNTLMEVGQTLVASLHEMDVNVPIIVTYPQSTNVADLKKYCPDASAYLVSPFSNEQLREVINQHVHLLTA